MITAEIVIPEPGDPTALNILPAAVTLPVAATQQLTGEVLWDNISPTDETAFTTWASSTPSVATVSAGGVVTAVALGSTTITGTYTHPVDEFVDTCPVTVAATAHAWTGTTPTAVTDGGSYEIGSWFTVTEPTTLIGVRIWNPGLVAPGGGQPRAARLWTHNGSGGSVSTQRTITLPTVMPVGWSEPPVRQLHGNHLRLLLRLLLRRRTLSRIDRRRLRCRQRCLRLERRRTDHVPRRSRPIHHHVDTRSVPAHPVRYQPVLRRRRHLRRRLGVHHMALPVNLATCTVTGNFVNPTAHPASGTVTFTPCPARLLDVGATPPTTILGTPIVAVVTAGLRLSTCRPPTTTI